MSTPPSDASRDLKSRSYCLRSSLLSGMYFQTSSTACFASFVFVRKMRNVVACRASRAKSSLRSGADPTRSMLNPALTSASPLGPMIRGELGLHVLDGGVHDRGVEAGLAVVGQDQAERGRGGLVVRLGLRVVLPASRCSRLRTAALPARACSRSTAAAGARDGRRAPGAPREGGVAGTRSRAPLIGRLYAAAGAGATGGARTSRRCGRTTSSRPRPRGRAPRSGG